jgi:hypothetical protein
MHPHFVFFLHNNLAVSVNLRTFVHPKNTPKNKKTRQKHEKTRKHLDAGYGGNPSVSTEDRLYRGG